MTDPSRYLVVGTAGHIDHGKTTLIERLTGIFLDTLPEERDRGITIALGFTHMDLPSGRQLAFVDVPGHERLVRTMVAGASGIDAVMLCVSAVDGVMPQTREHLAILGLLGVEHGLVALTFADQVDEELLMLAEDDVQDALRGTPLEGAPVVPCSGVTGLGAQRLVEELDRLQPRARALEGPFRLPVDRVFSQHGHGTVITGTVRSGALSEGDDVEVIPGSPRVRVRGLQVHGASVQSTRAGLRTAMNLSLSREEIERGHEVVTPGSVVATRVVDVAYHHLAGAPVIEDGAEVRFLNGTAEVVAHARPLGVDQVPPQEDAWTEPTTTGAWEGFLQLRLAGEVACLPGDRFVLRRASPVLTLGGGTVLDPWARPVRHRDRARAADELTRLAAGATEVLLDRAGLRGLTVAEARQRACHPGEGRPWAVALGDRVLHAGQAEALLSAVESALARYHAASPLSPGAKRKELVGGLLRAVDDRLLEALLEHGVAAGRLGKEQGRYQLGGFTLQLDDDQRAAMGRIEEGARRAGLLVEPAWALAALAAHRDGEALVHHLIEQGRLVRVGAFVGHAEVFGALVAEVEAWLAHAESFTPTQAKERWNLTRKHLIPVLEWLDAQRITRRVGDARFGAKRR
ncbi:MAG: selenocysteine-specific translation elongation factor [Pseudomonadota bacterium]